MSRSFDGVDDFVSVGNPAILKLTGAMTVMCWMNGPPHVSDARLISKQDGPTNRGWSLNGNAAPGAPYFEIARTASSLAGTPTALAVSNNTWTHIAATFIPSDTINLYLDGILRASSGGMPASQRDGTLNVNIGRRPDNILYFDGFIAYASIYNVALNVNEIGQVMRYPGSVTRGFVGFWPFYGQSLEGDYSDQENPGTVTGATVGTSQPPINGVGAVSCPGGVSY